VSCPLEEGKLINCTLLLQGPEFQADSIELEFSSLQRSLQGQFADWVINGLHYFLTEKPMVTLPSSTLASTQRSACMLVNSTAFGRVIQQLGAKWDEMFLEEPSEIWKNVREKIQALEDDHEFAESSHLK
jgi:tubulin alpha